MSDGGIMIADCTDSHDGDMVDEKGNQDAWIVKVNDAGELIWAKSYGGSDDDYADDIIQTSDDQYFASFCVKSNDGDVFGNHGDYDIWIMKFDISEILN